MRDNLQLYAAALSSFPQWRELGRRALKAKNYCCDRCGAESGSTIYRVTGNALFGSECFIDDDNRVIRSADGVVIGEHEGGRRPQGRYCRVVVTPSALIENGKPVVLCQHHHSELSAAIQRQMTEAAKIAEFGPMLPMF